MRKNNDNRSLREAGLWTSTQAYSLAVVCLALGVVLGYLFGGSAAPASPRASSSFPVAGVQNVNAPGDSLQAAAAPLLAQLERDPGNVEVLARLGNIYFDGQQYPQAIRYYERALQSDPTNVNIRTDMGTAYFYSGQPERALAEFQKSLQYDPTHANTLFNIGVVKWQALKDSQGAIQSWKELLRRNPTYEQRGRVEELIARAEQGPHP